LHESGAGTKQTFRHVCYLSAFGSGSYAKKMTIQRFPYAERVVAKANANAG